MLMSKLESFDGHAILKALRLRVHVNVNAPFHLLRIGVWGRQNTFVVGELPLDPTSRWLRPEFIKLNKLNLNNDNSTNLYNKCSIQQSSIKQNSLVSHVIQYVLKTLKTLIVELTN